MNYQEEHVILVDENDNSVGTMEKLEAHRKGLLHRAVSVFIVNHKGEMLLQKRAQSKYHGAGLWSNACCTHPRLNESTLDCAMRRMQEELGMSCHLAPAYSFIYKASVENNLVEHEFDYVFVGKYDGVLVPNRNEVEECIFVPLENIEKRLLESPEVFTIWFRTAFVRVNEYLAGMESHPKGGVE
jgi:isopentenyl-diphosphate delta-isomerase